MSLKYFFNQSFSQAFPHIEGVEFSSGWHLDDMCDRLQKYDRTTTIGARSHSKSTVDYAKVCWHGLRTLKEPCEIFVISGSKDMAMYHTKKMRQYIEAMMDMNLLGKVRFNNNAETEIELKNDDTGLMLKIMPKGLFSKYLGAHPHIVICEDILGKPEERVMSLELKRAEKQFKTVISKLPKKERGELHVIGNAQSADDLHFQLRDMKDPVTHKPIYNWVMYPAFTPGPDGQEPKPPTFRGGRILWPEVWSYEDLMREYGQDEDSFMTQFMCKPMTLKDSYFRPGEFENLEEGWTLLDSRGPKEGLAFGGYDPGQMRNPAHACVFVMDNDGALWQQEDKWFEVGTPWDDQIQWMTAWWDTYSFVKFLWDNSRHEIALAYERQELPPEFAPMPLNAIQNKNRVASAFKRYVQQKKIHLFEQEQSFRTLEQILVVDNELKAPDTKMGHGDSFWTVGMACLAAGENTFRPIGTVSTKPNPLLGLEAEQMWNRLEPMRGYFNET